MKGRQEKRPVQPRVNINDGIRAKTVRLIDPDGVQMGVVSLQEALAFAEEKELDLVQMAETEEPPCKVMDYSKYRYELQRKEKAARRNSQRQELKQIRLRPKIAIEDYKTKRKAAIKFLESGATVQVQVFFRGAENRHPEIGARLLDRMIVDLEACGKPNGTPLREGKSLNLLFHPIVSKAVVAKKAAKSTEPAADAPDAAADSAAS